MNIELRLRLDRMSIEDIVGLPDGRGGFVAPSWIERAQKFGNVTVLNVRNATVENIKALHRAIEQLKFVDVNVPDLGCTVYGEWPQWVAVLQ